MKNNKNIILIIVSIVILGGLLAYGSMQMKKTVPSSSETASEVIETTTVTYSCDQNKSIDATYYLPGDEHVALLLSDGRSMTLPHVISGSGARYATSDESIVFWNKGTTAFITENNTTTYANCNQESTDQEVPAQPQPSAGSSVHIDMQDGLTFCTMEAKQCPDGSYVGRSGPSCEFSACPGN